MYDDVDFNKKLSPWQTALLVIGTFTPAIAYVATVYIQLH